MKPIVSKIVNGTMRALIPAAVYGLGIICPVVPSFIWTALLNAIVDGNVTTEHLQQFLKDHDITTHSAPDDFPPQHSNFADGTSTQAWKDKGHE